MLHGHELRRLASIRRFLTSTATATHVYTVAMSRIDYCSSLLFGSTHDVIFHLQRIQNYVARVIFRLPILSSIATLLKSLYLLPVKARSTYKIPCLCYHYHMSLTLCRKSHQTPTTLAPAHAPCLFSMYQHTVRQHLVIVRFPLLLLLYETLFPMMSDVLHHNRHLILV